MIISDGTIKVDHGVTKRALRLAAEWVVNRTETCPLDQFDWNRPGGCEMMCVNQLVECWELYFEEKAQDG